MDTTQQSRPSLKRAREDEASYSIEDPLVLHDSPKKEIPQLSVTPQDANSFRRESTPSQQNTSASSSALSSPAETARSRTGSVTSTATPVAPGSPSAVTAFSALNGIPNLPKKRVKLSFAEKELAKQAREIRDMEKAEEKSRKEEEKKSREYEKAQRDAVKAVERQRKEAEAVEKKKKKEVRDAEREKEQKIKDEARQQRQTEKRRHEEEQRRKDRAQPTLFAFMKPPNAGTVSSVRKASESPGPGDNLLSSLPTTPQPIKTKEKNTQTEYARRFPAFYVHEGMRLAPAQFQSDEQHKQSIQHTIDSFLSGEQALAEAIFDPLILFHIPDISITSRKKRIIPVREIMAQILGSGDSSQPIDLTQDPQSNLAHVNTARAEMKNVPYKIFSFAEDVRPPYKGTATQQSLSNLRKLARNPTKKDLPEIDYDYDSEAEWEAPGEGEDLDSDGEEEEDLDGDDDIDGFLDDENDELVNTRKLNKSQGDLEVKTTGLCWESYDRASRNSKVSQYKMVLLDRFHDKLPTSTPIDPFSTSYWQDLPAVMVPPRLPLNTMKSTSSSVNGLNKPVKMFGIPDSTSMKPGSQVSKVPKRLAKMVASTDMPAFKQAIQGSDLSKLGLIEVLNKQFTNTSKAAIKATLEIIAQRVGNKEAEKRWALIEGAAVG